MAALRARIDPDHLLTHIGLPVLTFSTLAFAGVLLWRHELAQVREGGSAREAWVTLICLVALGVLAGACVWLLIAHWRRDRAHAAAVDALTDVAAGITDSPDQPHRGLQRVTELAADLLKMPMYSLNLYTPEDGLMRVVCRGGIPGALKMVYRLDELPANKECFRTGELLFIPSCSRDKGRFDASPVRDYGIESLVVIPLLVQGKPIGSISLFDTRARELTHAQLRMAQLWARQAAVIIRNAKLFVQTREDAETKAVLLRELNHRVKNNLAGIAGLLTTSPPQLPADVRTWLDRVIARIDSLSRVHELFVNGAGCVTLPDLIRKSINSALAVRPAGVNVKLDLQGDQIKLRTDQAVTLAMAMHELCFNALRHGVNDQGTITVRSVADENARVTIEVIDDGSGQTALVGAPAPVATQAQTKVHGTTGLGLSLVRGLVGRELRGEFNIESRPGAGTTATIYFGGDDGKWE